MKNLKLLLIVLLIVSCSKDDDGCGCIKENYNVILGEVIEAELVSTESVSCQEEKTVFLTEETYYEIKCK